MRTGSVDGVLRAVLFDTFSVMLFLYVSSTLVHRVKTCM